MSYTTDPIVSSDIVGDPHSCCIFDGEFTLAIGDNMVKVMGWYDNEFWLLQPDRGPDRQNRGDVGPRVR